VQGLSGRIYTASNRNPKGGTAASTYGPYEEARGGAHAAYANTFKGDAPGVMNAIKIIVERAAMSVQSRKAVREELGQVLAMRSDRRTVYTDQPADFDGQSPVVVVASAGSERDGSATQRTFGGPVAAVRA
jgi:hypothetical protein